MQRVKRVDIRYPFLKEVDSMALRCSINDRDINASINIMFEGIKMHFAS